MDSGAVGVLGIASGSVCLERKGERSASRAESLRLQPMLLPVLGKPTTPFPWKFLSVSASAKSSLRAGVGSHALHQLLALHGCSGHLFSTNLWGSFQACSFKASTHGF